MCRIMRIYFSIDRIDKLDNDNSYSKTNIARFSLIPGTAKTLMEIIESRLKKTFAFKIVDDEKKDCYLSMLRIYKAKIVVRYKKRKDQILNFLLV